MIIIIINYIIITTNNNEKAACMHDGTTKRRMRKSSQKYAVLSNWGLHRNRKKILSHRTQNIHVPTYPGTKSDMRSQGHGA